MPLSNDELVSQIITQNNPGLGGPAAPMNSMMGANVPPGSTPIVGNAKTGGTDWKELMKWGGLGAMSGLGIGPGLLLQLILNRNKNKPQEAEPAPIAKKKGGPIKAKSKAKVKAKPTVSLKKMAAGGEVKSKVLGCALRGHNYKAPK